MFWLAPGPFSVMVMPQNRLPNKDRAYGETSGSMHRDLAEGQRISFRDIRHGINNGSILAISSISGTL